MFRQRIPWWGKIIAKICLSRLPVRYEVWRALGIFKHGQMHEAEYLTNVFENHFNSANLSKVILNKHILELGPGDSVGTAVVAASFGARATLLDIGHFAHTDIRVYRELSRHLSKTGLPAPDLDGANSIEDVLEICNAKYFTGGLDSFRLIASESVDFVFSEAVLEHVRKKEFQRTIDETFRVLVPGGRASHGIDFRDHLGGGLNNLRFSEKLWESNFFSQSGFYTNRLRWSEVSESFKCAGFEEMDSSFDKWETLPICPQRLHKSFRSFALEDLLIKGANITLRANKQP